MIFYLLLDLKRLSRYFESSGIKPVFAFLIVITIFFVGGIWIFKTNEHAPYVFSLIPFIIFYYRSTQQRFDFLKTMLSNYRIFRLLENILVSIPFVLFLLFFKHFSLVLLVLLTAIVYSFFDFKRKFSFIIPTPFKHIPFEFPRGFRYSFFVFPILFSVTIISAYIGNAKLCIFTILASYLITSFYFTPMEPEQFIWIETRTPLHFLWSKLKMSILYSNILALFPFILSAYFFSNDYFLISLSIFFGFLYQLVNFLGKYAYYPNEIRMIPQIVLSLGYMFPPLLIVLVPYFFLLSKRNLKDILC